MDTSVAALEESMLKSGLFSGNLLDSQHSPSLSSKRPIAQLVNIRSNANKLGNIEAPLQLDKILKLLPTGVVLLDSRGTVADCNDAAQQLLDGPLRGSAWRDVIARNFQPRGDDGHEISLRNGKRISLLTRSLEDEPGQLIVLNDLTETRMLQQQLARHQRLSDMGKMISSLAHQIRTPLSAALLYTDNLATNFGQVPGVTKYTGKLLSRLQNIERQIRDMLFFVRGDAELNEQLTLPVLVQRLEKEVDEVIPEAARKINWQKTKELVDSSGYINCHSDALFGAVLNLIENALQANQNQGQENPHQIDVIVELISNDSPSNTNKLRVSVEDRGCGISSELLERIQEGFVTTKANGTGLGLAVVRLVAGIHRADFELEQRDEGGTCASITLPVVSAGEVT